MTVVPDTSVVVDGRISEKLSAGELDDDTIAVPEAVVAELEQQANEGYDTGWDGLGELERLAKMADSGEVTLKYVGERPVGVTLGANDEGRIDALIRDLAEELDATFLTSDVVQSEVARAKGLDVEYVAPVVREVTSLGVESYFDEETMSVHLKAGDVPRAKRGTLGEMRYEVVAEEPISSETMDEYAREVVDAAKESSDGFLELSEPGMNIVQFRDYRIAVARPPFADGIEVTAVRPIAETNLDEYAHSDALKTRLLERQRGVLVSGAPGAGKSTFAQAAATFIADNDYSVKTMEKPRDLQVGPQVTQYTELGGEMKKTADSLLMVRPDYTIYDEVRTTDDFEVFADMRLAGVGMIGVVHATRAIDALQRLVGRVELGMIPQVVDTVVFIEAGEVTTVYDVHTEVKVPAGLTEEDLARPVILIEDFETGQPVYEIYTFNRQVVTVPLDDTAQDAGVDRLARQEVEREIRTVADGHVEVELAGRDRAVVYVEQRDISTVIGKGGGRIQEIENRLGIDIDVRTLDDRTDGPAGGGQPSGRATTPSDGSAEKVVQPEVGPDHVIIPVDDYAGETVEVEADGEYLFTATVGRAGEISVSRGSAIAEELERALDRRRQITVLPASG